MTASTADAPSVRLSGPADVVVAIPFLVGFHPSDSVVLLGICDNRTGPVSRFDLAAVADASSAAEVGEWSGRWFRNQGADSVIVVGYGDPSGLDGGYAALRLGLIAGGVAVDDILGVHDGSYRSLLCDDPLCCHIEGRPMPDPSCSAVATALIAAGLVALDDRDQLVADIAVADRDAQAAEAVAEAVSGWRSVTAPEVRLNRQQAVRLVVSQLRRAASTPVTLPVLSDHEAVELTAALQDVLVRDAMLAFVLPPWSEQLERLLVCVVRTAAADAAAAAPLTLLAAVAWSRGQGARAAILLDRALEADPDYRLAYLWDRGLRMGLPPSEIEAICRDAGRAVVRDLIGRMPRPPRSQRTRRAAGSG